MPRIVVERSFDQPPSDEDLTAAGIRERPCLDLHGVAWRRSLLSTDRLRMVCEYEAPMPKACARSNEKPAMHSCGFGLPT
jgi:hypothetical protein